MLKGATPQGPGGVGVDTPDGAQEVDHHEHGQEGGRSDDVALANVAVTDDNGTPDDLLDDFTPDAVLEDGFNVGDVNRDSLLGPGEEWLYTATVTASCGVTVNVATLTGTPVAGGEDVTDSDPAAYRGIRDCKCYRPACSWRQKKSWCRGWSWQNKSYCGSGRGYGKCDFRSYRKSGKRGGCKR